MPDNTLLNPGTGGDLTVTREISHSGDTAKLAGSFLMGVSGTEGSYTVGAINGDATNGLDVDVVRLPALAAGTNVIGKAGVCRTSDGAEAVLTNGSADGQSTASNALVTAPYLFCFNGTTWDRVRGDATDGLLVNLGANNDVTVSGTVTVASHAVTNAGTFAVQAASAGDVAHDAADSGNPTKVGGVARTSDPAVVASGDRVNFIADVNGKQIVHPYALPENLVAGATAAITNTTDTSVIAAAGAGVRNYVTSLSIVNSHATVSTVVELKDGSTVIWRGYALAAGGGMVVNFPSPLRGTANTAINAAAVTTGSNVYVSASGFKAP